MASRDSGKYYVMSLHERRPPLTDLVVRVQGKMYLVRGIEVDDVIVSPYDGFKASDDLYQDYF